MQFFNRTGFLRDALKKAGDRGNTIVGKVSTGKEFLAQLEAATKQYGSIKNLVVYNHSGPGGLYMREDRGFFRNPGDIANKVHPETAFLDELKMKLKEGKIKFDKDAVVLFAACGTAGPKIGKDEQLFSLAAEFAKAANVTTIGSVGSADQSHADRNGKTEYSPVGWVQFDKTNPEGRRFVTQPKTPKDKSSAIRIITTLEHIRVRK